MGESSHTSVILKNLFACYESHKENCHAYHDLNAACKVRERFQTKHKKITLTYLGLFFSFSALLNLSWHEAHQPLLDNNAVRAIKHGLGSPTATLNNLAGVLVEEEVTELLCDEAPAPKWLTRLLIWWCYDQRSIPGGKRVSHLNEAKKDQTAVCQRLEFTQMVA